MIVYKRKFIRIAESWEGEDPEELGVDIVRRFQQPRPLDGMSCRDFYTILIGLNKNLETLLTEVKRDTRNEIRRATREGFVADFWIDTTADVLNEFCDYFDDFAADRSLPVLRRPWLALLADSGILSLSRITEPGGQPLVWHCYHHTAQRATLLYSASSRNCSCSAERSRMGRANRLLHWQDILKFKQLGLATYDLGGWYEGKKDQKLLSINRFKEEFGGVVVHNYICERALTLRGSLFLRLRQTILGNAI